MTLDKPLPIPVTFHQDLRACLKKMEPQEIRTFLAKIEDNNGADVIEALFHPPGAMDSLLKGCPCHFTRELHKIRDSHI